MAAQMARAATGPSMPDPDPRATKAMLTATNPSNTNTSRCNRMRPAVIAPSPRRTARLNAFEPITIPIPIVRWPRATPVMAAVISGPSAARAATRPRAASRNPRRAATRSNLETSTTLAERLTAAETTNNGHATRSEVIEVERCELPSIERPRHLPLDTVHADQASRRAGESVLVRALAHLRTCTRRVGAPRCSMQVATLVAAYYARSWQRAKARPREEGPSMKRIGRWSAACAAVATLSLGIALPAGASGGSHV